MRRVLVTGGGGAAIGALTALWSERYEVHFADADPGAISPAVPADRRHPIPFANAPDFVEAMAELVRTLGVDVVVPAVDEELPHIPAVLERVPGLRALLPNAAFVALMLDKYESAMAWSGAGLDAPWTVRLDDPSGVRFPCIVKPRQGRGSRGVAVISDAEELRAWMVLARRPADQLIAQELMTGQEYTVMVSADQTGRLRAVVPVRVDLKRGVTLRGTTEAHPAVIEACRRLHAAFPTSSTYNVQCILGADGRVGPFEVNPRISTTSCLAIAAGVDPLAVLNGEFPGDTALLPFRSGITLRRTWLNEIS